MSHLAQLKSNVGYVWLIKIFLILDEESNESIAIGLHTKQIRLKEYSLVANEFRRHF